MASTSNSPRGAMPAPPSKVQNSPRGDKLDSSQLTPRRRNPELQNLLPNKITASSKTFTPRPKAAPRAILEAVEDEPKKKGDSLRVPSGRYGHRGGGDCLLRLPLEGMSKLEIKGELKHGRMPLKYGNGLDDDDDEGVESEEDEEEHHNSEDTETEPKQEVDQARFNVWKGKNYELHLLGDFKSDFEKRVKSFQRPDTEPIRLDPFCRSESSLLDEPPNSNAFLVWKSKPSLKWSSVGNEGPALSSPFPPVSSGDDEEVDVDDDDGDSLPDPDIKEYILEQQLKREEGLNVTGESLYYDEDYEMVRNLHRDSYSLTNYGAMPDDKWIGKADIFYPEMTEAEKKMLRVPEKKKLSSLSPRIAVVRRANK